MFLCYYCDGKNCLRSICVTTQQTDCKMNNTTFFGFIVSDIFCTKDASVYTKQFLEPTVCVVFHVNNVITVYFQDEAFGCLLRMYFILCITICSL